MSAFLDTNILVYLFDAADADKQAKARQLLRAHAGERRAVLSTQVLQEFYAVVTRRLRKPLASPVALEALREFAEFPLVVITPPLILAAAARSSEDGMSFWDALVVESAMEVSAEVLYSEDLQDGRRFGPVVVRNPFAPGFRIEG